MLGLPEAATEVSGGGVASRAVIPSGNRNRLARDLHDSVGQFMNALLVEIRVAIDRGVAGRDDLLILEREAENALQAVRALAYRIRQRPASNPLADAQRYGNRLLSATGGVLHWIDERDSVRLAYKVSKHLAWSIRESITNAVQHGRARSVEVRLIVTGARVRVTIRDDGIGFAPEEIRPGPDGRGLGLLGNAERMAEVGGIFNIRSRPGEGAVAVLETPRYLRRVMVSRRPAGSQPAINSEKPEAAAAAN